MSDYQLIEGDAVTEMKRIADASVDLIAADPPYFRVKDDAWDNAWDSRDKFLAWLGTVADEWKRILKPNGSLYVFASPQMAWYVEGLIHERFNVLNKITWVKPEPTSEINRGASNGGRVSKELLRRYYPNTETLIFAEQGNSDAIADEIAGFTEAETELKHRIFGEYLAAEFKRANVTNKKIAALFPSAAGGLTGCVSNWILGLNVPTPEQYDTMRCYLNNANGHSDYLRTQYEDLRTQYEDLRTQYEDLRTQYEDLRRPFYATPDAPYTDVWTFPTVQARSGKHPCEKPLALMEHIVSLSSRPGTTVLDCFMGSGTTGHACINLERNFIGIDMSAHWVRYSERRLRDAKRTRQRQPKQLIGNESDLDGLPLFA